MRAVFVLGTLLLAGCASTPQPVMSPLPTAPVTALVMDASQTTVSGVMSASWPRIALPKPPS